MKKLIAMLLAVAMLAATVMGCGGNGGDKTTAAPGTTAAPNTTEADKTDAPDEKPYEATVWFQLPSTVPNAAEIERIAGLVSEVTKKEINATVKIEIYPFSQYNDTLSLALSALEPIDLCTTNATRGVNFYNQGFLNDMNDLLDQYGQDVLKSYASVEIAKAAQTDGHVVMVPVHKETAQSVTLFARKDIIDELGLLDEFKKVNSWETIDALFQKIMDNKDKFENLQWAIAPEPGKAKFFNGYDGLNSSVTVGVINNLRDGNTDVVSLYETEEFKEDLKWMHKWFANGWINPGIASDTESYYSYIASHQAACFLSDYDHPLSLADQQKNCSNEPLYMQSLCQPWSTTGTAAVFGYAIPAGSKDPVKAMQLLNLICTSTEIMNLINWGEEGVDYVVNSDKLCDYPEGKDANSVAYHLGAGWILPNQFVCTPWATDGADIYEKVGAYNATASVSPVMGFAFDGKAVEAELAALNDVVNTYNKGLVSGAVDPEDPQFGLQAFIDAMNAAGFQKVLEEQQKQVKAFLGK